MTEPFRGAKLALLAGDRIVTILRDDIPTIPWPGHWDLPGGGREGDETPEACVLRELREELAVDLPETALTYRARGIRKGKPVWFFAAEWPGFDESAVVFGNEGQTWRLAPIDWFLNEAKAVAHQQENLRRYLAQRRP
ncbi:MAG: NUDIX hydrolase [Silicimonas sp.]|nr:NUDIX hydrolase [Silicimonas sp.]